MSGLVTSKPAALILRATQGWGDLRLGELWDYRELLYFFVWSHIKVRYKQAFLGAAWAILQPLLTTVVFTIFFGYLGRVGSEGLPYALFSFAALLPWTFVSQGVAQAAESLVAHQNLIKKVFFPRLILPMSAVLSKILDFVVGFLFLILMMVYYGVTPTMGLVHLPVLFLYALAVAAGFGIWLAVLNVEYRDVHHLVPFFVQIGLFVTPVIYPASRVEAKLGEFGVPAWLYGLNPMAGVVEGFRWALFGGRPAPTTLIVPGLLVAGLLLSSGVVYFRRVERTFADIV
jgi:lipopolysaccharide transport system permease protein